jgi:hypothetical protein
MMRIAPDSPRGGQEVPKTGGNGLLGLACFGTAGVPG